MFLSKLQIDKAVDWWVAALVQCLTAYIKQPGGAIKKQAFLTDLGQLFATSLRRVLLDPANQTNIEQNGLLVDFHAEGLLKKACEQVGLNCFLPILPTKTHMRFASNGVQVGSSFGSREKVVL